MHKAGKAIRPASGKGVLTQSIMNFASKQEHPVTKAFASRLADHFKAYMAERLLYGDAWFLFFCNGRVWRFAGAERSWPLTALARCAFATGRPAWA
jgi:hypothetical protein